jgi:hypothetical protein
MKPLVLKWRLVRASPDIIKVTVFYGEEGQTMQNAGTLNLRIGEYQITAAALGIGAERTKGRLKFETEGEEEALRS